MSKPIGQMTDGDWEQAHTNAFLRDEARYQASIARDPADDDYFFDDIDPADESLGPWVDERIRFDAVHVPADQVASPDPLEEVA